MALDTNGTLLEGIRLANANNPFNFPPKNLVTDQGAFDAVTNRLEYTILAGTSDLSVKATDIGDPSLRFNWTRNEGSVSRFTYDGFSQKWLPAPGAPPSALGVISNSPRLVAPIPDIDVSDAPFSIFIGETSRTITFSIQVVGTAGDFSTTSPGIVQLALDTGQLNFNATDLVTFAGQIVRSQRQSFFDRTRFKGQIGTLPLSDTNNYFIHLNPLPASGQLPRIRIDYRSYLTPVQVANESLLGTPATGTFTWALDTGRIRVSPVDLATAFGKSIYYDGIHNASASLVRTVLGNLTSAWPAAGFTDSTFIGVTDPVQLLVFAELSGVRSYFPAKLISNSSLPSQQPTRGQCYVNTDNGQILFNASDVSNFSAWTFLFVNTILQIDKGVSIQFFRSSVNTGGIPVVADFTIIYFVENQIVVDGLGPFPFVQLPTNPIVDDDLEYSIETGPSSSGTFAGFLSNSDDPDQGGFGYGLNLDQKQFRFFNRKSVTLTLAVPTPTLKLQEGLVSPFGFEVFRNGFPIVAGVDFLFDNTTGQLQFLQSIGISGPGTVTDIPGSIVAPSTFLPDITTVFDFSSIGKYIYIGSGVNIGIYQITDFAGDSVRVTPNFISDEVISVDLRSPVDVVADNFWVPFTPVYRKIHVSKFSVSGDVADFTGFSAFPTNGQINVQDAALPGDSFETDYFFFTPTQISTSVIGEPALFKVRQESATTSPGSNIIQFNPSNRTVSQSRSIDISINGVTQKVGTFQLVDNTHISLQIPVESGQTVVLDYWVQEALGGETSFQLLNSPLDIDILQINLGQTSIVLNGDQRPVFSVDSVVLSDLTGQVLLVSDVDYDAIGDLTTVTFSAPSNFSTGPSDTFQVSSRPISPVLVPEVPDTILKNTSDVRLSGKVLGIAPGSILFLDDDAFNVTASVYDAALDKTVVSVGVLFIKNYINPQIFRSSLPVFFDSKSFQTHQSANVSQDVILVLMGDDRKILIRDVDYRISEGGSIELSSPIGGHNSLYALYVANQDQAIGDIFEFNYAHAIAPDDVNGLAGQRLVTTYNLFSPDNYFYRVETVQTFLPEVQDLLRQSSQSSGVSGPNTRDAKGRANKDEGSSSPYFDEQHYYNLDFSIVQLLKFYNDLVNLYEDLLSNIDGRIVGGQNGRFRFDGNLDNPPRNTYAEITNDLDDKFLLYTKQVLTGFFTFDSVPVYALMTDYSAKSRVFPLQIQVSAAINNQVGPSNNGKVLGTLGVEDITGSGNFISTPATAISDSIVASGVTTVINFASNGDSENLVPPFELGTTVAVYSNVGGFNVSGPVTVVNPTSITIGVAATLVTGTIARDISDPDDTTVSRYKTGLDIGINTETGEIINITNSFTLPGNPQVDIKGQEILDVVLRYNNTDTSPRRIPVLDGSEHNDYGFFPVPRLRREGEIVLLNKELIHLQSMGIATVSVSLTVLFTPIFASVGDSIRFINGPNAGQSRSVSFVVLHAATSIYIMDSAFLAADSIGSTAEKILKDSTRLDTTLSAELGIMSTNDGGTPLGSIETIFSELKTVTSLVQLMGIELSSGTSAPINSTVFQDLSANFSLDGVGSQSFLYISNGANQGIYKVQSATATQITVVVDSIYFGFPSVGVSAPYTVVDLESFVTSNGMDFLAPYLRDLMAFITATQTWKAAPTDAGKAARITAINSRMASDSTYLDGFSNLLRNTDQLYNIRYLWIQQRADKKTGLLTQRNQAIQRRQESLIKIVEDQQKLLIINAL